jgi:16S rRNA processing protein RimM
VPDSRIQVGVIGRPHGVRGLLRVTSHTADAADLTAYGPLYDPAGRTFALRWKADGIAEVSVVVDGIAVKVADRTAAEKLTNTRLFIDRSALPPAEDDEYYLADLIGLTAVDPGGAVIGTVAVVHDYGAGASLEIVQAGGGAVILPFTCACVPAVDIAAGRLVAVLPNEIAVLPNEAVPPQDQDAAA